tara:strand:- start:10141 stop:10809 length:669 start_codon:yes stop_codon:yes gene_type:complete
MARNPHFRENVSSEQKLIEDLSIEIIQTMGKDMIYIPRTLVRKDDLFGEDTTSKFSNGYPIEMYIQSVDGFEGEGDILGKFGIEIKDRVSLVVAKRRFNESVGSYASLERPKEGDLIYFPLSDGLFEINFVEHENPFYQLGKLYGYRLDCELFTYSHEDFETGESEIDDTQTERQKDLGDHIVPLDPSTGATAGDNDSYEDFKNIDNIFDFTDKDPFSEGNY